MDDSAPQFYQTVVFSISTILLVVTLLTELAAFFHCLVQQSRLFPAISTFPKGAWLAMIAGSALFVLLGFGQVLGPLAGMLSLVPITIALVYLLDVRPALREAASGSGPW